LQSARAPLDLHSFPPRRSSDLRPPGRPYRPGAYSGADRRLRTVPHAIRVAGVLSGNLRHAAQGVLMAAAFFVTGTDTEIGKTTIDRKSTRLNSSHVKISYAVFC